MAEDWDLQAVVRGCTATSSPSSTCHVTNQLFSSFTTDPIFDPFFTPKYDDLSDFFTPFLPNLQPLSPLSVLGGLPEMSPPVTVAPAPESGVKRCSKVSPSPRSKRRKNQMKRVCEVPVEGLSSDSWSWRKYGQKPIKGSPYPRGYYKCSTMKGCLARKQVERSRSDPGLFIITYTGDHTHPMPTHRNSLSGLTRHVIPKLSTVTDSLTGGDSSKPHSPVSQDKMDDDFSGSDLALSEDFFEGLEGLAGDCLSGQFPVDFPLTFRYE